MESGGDKQSYIYWALVNNKKYVIVPGAENYFDGIEYNTVMAAKGEFRAVLPIPGDQTVGDFIKKYSDDSFKWKVHSANEHDPLLIISNSDQNKKFEIKLATSPQPINVPNLAFHLTYCDAKALLELKHSKLNDQDNTTLNSFISKGDGSQGRRKAVLIGNSLCSPYSTCLTEGIFIYSSEGSSITDDIRADAAKLKETFEKDYGNVEDESIGNFGFADTKFAQNDIVLENF